MKYVCLGFISAAKYEALSEAEGRQLMEECFAYDDELRRGGHFVGGEALQAAQNAVTLRIKNGSVDVTDGPYAETKEMLGGILFLEAHDLNHAISLMSRHPGVRVGPFEIRPADEGINQRIAERHAVVRPDPNVQQSRNTLSSALQFSYAWIKPLADDLLDSPLTSPTPDIGNHPLWIMGHLVFSSASLLSMITGKPSTYQDWQPLFSGGTQPVSDAGIYPPYAQVLAAYDTLHLEMLECLAKFPDAQLTSPPPAVSADLRDNPEFRTVAQLFLFIAMHEMSHRGQLADARRALGRKPFA